MFPLDTDSKTEETPSAPPVSPDPTPVRPRGSVVAKAAALLAPLAVGVGLGWLVFSSPASDPVPPPTTAAAVEERVTPAATAEPVADVADALLPSVVQIETAQGLGSGVIYDSDGLIMTAAHVVEGNREVRVRLSDGTQYVGQVLGGDSAVDIAVVRVDATGLPAARLALGEDVRVGQLAVAIGSPYGLDSTVTSGVVSAVNQSVGGRDGFQSLIQTDAAINPGNSGGALANRAGEVIGINVSIFSQTGGNDGVGFAVPIDLASDLADSVVSGDPISTAVLGVSGTNAEGSISGALITGVDPESAAATSGIQIGDVITSVDGVRVHGIGDLAAQVQSHRPGDEIVLEIHRDGSTTETTATLGS